MPFMEFDVLHVSVVTSECIVHNRQGGEERDSWDRFAGVTSNLKPLKIKQKAGQYETRKLES